jgi:Stealth protein CR2, conserved region 2/Stealth protein CR3, conserved region 3
LPIRGPIDLVYTWVDDRWPGYRALLAKHARTPVDLDPGRTRDNLETLRFSLRSLGPVLPEVRKIHIVSCRPQVPDWLNLDHPQIKVVHHDTFMPPEMLPTFNSMAILSCLHLIPGLSERFLYLEDDMLLRPGFSLADLEAPDGRLRVYPWKYPLPDKARLGPDARPWNLALGESAALLDAAHGQAARRQICHMPLLIDLARWAQVLDRFAPAIARTRASRFRAAGNVDPATLYAWSLMATGQGEMQTLAAGRRLSGYVPLENLWPLTLWAAAQSHWRGAHWINVNDNLGDRPSSLTEGLARRLLQRWCPDPSPFERRHRATASE